MKKKLLTILSLITFMTVHADNVLTINGEEINRDFLSISHDYNNPDNILVTFTDSTTMSVNMNIIEVLPNAPLTDGIGNVTNEGGFFSIKKVAKDQLSISGIEGSQNVLIYSAGGSVVKKMKSQGSNLTIDIRSLNKGIYLLKVGNKVVKFNKE